MTSARRSGCCRVERKRDLGQRRMKQLAALTRERQSRPYDGISAPTLVRIQQHMNQPTLPVAAFLSGDKLHSVKGSLTFLDNRVSSDTGRIRLKATFGNNNRRLWPGQFVDVVTDIDHPAGCGCAAFQGNSNRSARAVRFRHQNGHDRRVPAGGGDHDARQRNSD